MQVDGAPPAEPPPLDAPELDAPELDAAPPELPPLPSWPVAPPSSVGPTSLCDAEPPHAAIVSHSGRHVSRILGKGGDRWASVIISVSLPWLVGLRFPRHISSSSRKNGSRPLGKPLKKRAHRQDATDAGSGEGQSSMFLHLAFLAPWRFSPCPC